MFFTEKDTELMDFVEQEFGKVGLFHHGMPLGIGIFDITTNSRHLDEFVKILDRVVERELSKDRPKLETDQDKLNFLLSLQGVEPSEEEAEWELHRRWVSSSKYKGHLREVRVWRSRKDGSYRSDITKFSEAVARTQLLTTTAMIRAKCNIVETENVARELLLGHLDDRQKKQYLLTDSFGEISKRSGIMYMLRRNRPTLAIKLKESSDGHSEGEPLCTLCMHPLAYYTGSWAGAMPPSDEILAHLLHIRSDEHRYWKICVQHRLSDYLGGL